MINSEHLKFLFSNIKIEREFSVDKISVTPFQFISIETHCWFKALPIYLEKIKATDLNENIILCISVEDIPNKMFEHLLLCGTKQQCKTILFYYLCGEKTFVRFREDPMPKLRIKTGIPVWSEEDMREIRSATNKNEVLYRSLTHTFSSEQLPKLCFQWRTKLYNTSATEIAMRYIGEPYRKRKLMKRVSLNLLQLLRIEYTDQHIISSSTIHVATYRFFHPQAHGLSYKMGIQTTTVGELLQKHGVYTAPKFCLIL